MANLIITTPFHSTTLCRRKEKNTLQEISKEMWKLSITSDTRTENVSCDPSSKWESGIRTLDKQNSQEMSWSRATPLDFVEVNPFVERVEVEFETTSSKSN